MTQNNDQNSNGPSDGKGASMASIKDGGVGTLENEPMIDDRGTDQSEA